MKNKVNVTNEDIKSAVKEEAPKFGVKIAFATIAFALDIISSCILNAMEDK